MTADMVVVFLLTIIGIGLTVSLVLPQTPIDGSNDPIAFSQWQAGAHEASGRSYFILSNLGLFDVLNTPILRVATWLALAMVALRILDRWNQWRRPIYDMARLSDGSRISVDDQALPWDEIRRRAIKRGLGMRVEDADRWVAFGSSTSSHASTIFMHTATLLGLLGVLLNMILGWSDPRTQVSPGGTALVANQLPIQLTGADPTIGAVKVSINGGNRSLSIGAPLQVGPDGVALAATEFTPIIRVRAFGADRKPLGGTVSNYAKPESEIVLTFRTGESEHAIKFASEGLVTVFSISDNRVRAFAVSSGRLVSEAQIAPLINFGQTELNVELQSGAIISAAYWPGTPLVIVGAALSLLGAIAVTLYPRQQILVRRNDGGWTEFYAIGRRAKEAVRQLSTVATLLVHNA